MAIDRVTPSHAALNIPDRTAREQPSQTQAVPPLPKVPQDGPRFGVDGGVPAAVGALMDAMDAQLSSPGTPAALAGKLAAAALLDEALSMQPNQLFMSRQLVWHPPDTSAMAASWLAMVRTYAEQRAALLQQTQGRHVPASLFLSDQAPAVLRDGRVPPQLVSELDAWRFAVYAWGAEKLVLRVVVPADDDDAAPPRRRRARIAVRLEIHLPGLGKVVLQMEPGEDGVLLEVGAAQEAARRHMREQLPRIAAVANTCGVRIARVRLMRELPAPSAHSPTAAHAALLSEALFKAMAEVAVLLSQPLPADELFFEPRA